MSANGYMLPSSVPAKSDELVIPCDINIERLLLGALICYPDSWFSIDGLRPELFFLTAHREIYQAIKSLLSKNREIDIHVIADFIGPKGIAFFGGMSWLLGFLDGVMPNSPLDEWVGILREKWQYRGLIDLSGKISRRAYLGDGSPIDMCSDGSNAMLSLTAGDRNPSIEEQSLAEFELLQRQIKGEQLSFLPSGILGLDMAVEGYAIGEMTVMAGRPMQGKSCALDQAVMVNCRRGNPCHLFSIEMRAGQVLRRIWSDQAQVPFHKIRHPQRLSPDEQKAISQAMIRVSEWPLIIDDAGTLTAEEIVAKARASKRRKGTMFVGIDYLQKLRFPGKSELRFQSITDATVAFARLAKEEQVVVLLISSLTEKNGKQRNDPPTLQDLRGSGDIQYEASMALLIHREIDDNTEQPCDVGQMIIAKGRSDQSGSFPIRFNRNYLTFE